MRVQRSFSDSEFNLKKNLKRQRSISIDFDILQENVKRIKLEQYEDKNKWIDTFFSIVSNASMFFLLVYIVSDIYYPVIVKMLTK